MEWYHIGVQSTGSERAYDADGGVVLCDGKALLFARFLISVYYYSSLVIFLLYSPNIVVNLIYWLVLPTFPSICI